MADAAIDLLGRGGAREISHGKVDRHANVPPGTTSFYFRTRKALLHAIAERVTELDIIDLSRMTELAGDAAAGYTGTIGLARLVVASNAEPFLTRSRARYELALQASREPELAAYLSHFASQITELTRQVIREWHGADAEPDDAALDEEVLMVLTCINGVMMSFVHGAPAVTDAEQLDRWLQTILSGVGRLNR
ncbi:TetR/AcrR family transcriptional regulator [Mycolicibacterium arseniciresistens]|uniref:TetR family transcriptional regulator n=1 Tax=Mycolicibacterium arseniciresistens TaxID=3062257 RepID=A0ABT8UCE0_9MYCO|nr:TetR family transcriptional regulator [Mycolicibacterium arseniciresistens]MDO3634525.1 TetR family transcriptional regulator [Mycolicibacterium arseniciresistens]